MMPPVTDSSARQTVALCGLGNMGAAAASRLVRRFRVIGAEIDDEKRADAAERWESWTDRPLTLPHPEAAHD